MPENPLQLQEGVWIGHPFCICRFCGGRAIIREDFTHRLAAICEDCGAGERASLADVQSANHDGRVVRS